MVLKRRYGLDGASSNLSPRLPPRFGGFTSIRFAKTNKVETPSLQERIHLSPRRALGKPRKRKSGLSGRLAQSTALLPSRPLIQVCGTIDLARGGKNVFPTSPALVSSPDRLARGGNRTVFLTKPSFFGARRIEPDDLLRPLCRPLFRAIESQRRSVGIPEPVEVVVDQLAVGVVGLDAQIGQGQLGLLIVIEPHFAEQPELPPADIVAHAEHG